MGLPTQTEQPNYSGIYEIRCIETGKVYVGSAVWIAKRWRDHKEGLRKHKHCNTYLQRAWDKYGEDGFRFSVIERVEKDFLIPSEQYYIDSMLACNQERGYNGRPVADSNRGAKFSPEACKRISDSHKGRIVSDEAKRKLSERMKGNNYRLGIPHNEETKKKLCDIRKGRTPSLGMKHTEANRKKISDRFSGIKLSSEHKEKIRLAHVGKKQSVDHRKNLALIQKKLDDDQVRSIFSMLKSGEPVRSVASKLGVSTATIYNIKNGKVEVYKWAL